MTDFVSQFTQHLENLGYKVNGAISADDRVHRIKVNEDKTSSASYQLKIDANFAVGWFRSFRDGVTHKWHSSSNEKMSEDERKALKLKLKLEREQKEQERKKQALEATHKAEKIWDQAKRVDESHAYIIRKKIEALGARQYKGALVIPIYSEGQLKSLQFIDGDGSKKFLKNGEIQGGYCCIIFKNDSHDRIVLCEGWATGVSIRMATGLPVIVAFNASNLEPVAAAIRKKYPDSELIIAADNDAFTSIGNVGIKKGTEAAQTHGCLLCHPEFNDVSSKPTDFNDLHVLEGKEKVAEAINGAELVAPEPSEPNLPSNDNPSELDPPAFEDIPLEAYAEDAARMYDEETAKQSSLYTPVQHTAPDSNWRDLLILTDKGHLKPNSLTNIALILENDDRYRDLFCYDEFAKEKMLINCPPWDDPEKFKVRPVVDEDKTRLAIDLEIKKGLSPSPVNLKAALDSVILRKSRNPAVEYMNSLEWDGKPRLDTWLSYYLGCEEDDQNYLRMVGRRWLTAAVYRVFEPGTKFDHMIILEGKQGIAKSFALEKLATVYGRTYFDDTLKVTDLGSDKSVPKLQGILICELAEMSGLNRKDVSELKQSITVTRDRIVRKYANEASYYPRQFVFAGTINPLKGYLKDATGDRRFWPVSVGQVDLDALDQDKDQLWAEAVHAYRNKERIWVNEDERYFFEEAQTSRRAEDPWQGIVDTETKHLDRVRGEDMSEIWSALGVDKSKRDAFLDDRISKILAGLGFEWKRKQVGGTREYMWVRDKKAKKEELF
jgi:predicted P-loop ATPase/phage/plasmid primase-like uncharacterized protein